MLFHEFSINRYNSLLLISLFYTWDELLINKHRLPTQPPSLLISRSMYTIQKAKSVYNFCSIKLENQLSTKKVDITDKQRG
jgi:hypothetical protein